MTGEELKQKIRTNFTTFLSEKEKPLRVIYISSYIPRKCGIATFTKDLTNAANILNPEALAEIVAVNDMGEEYDYPWEVKYRVNQANLDDYTAAENYINQSSADIINLQHEFGLFGGVDGEYVLPFLDSLNKPLVTCFHSILPEPDEHKKYIMKRIIDRSSAVIAMTKLSKDVLVNVYDCPEDKAVVIYHGVPDFTFNESKAYKKKLKVHANNMILMSGLIGPGKGIEYAISAMPEILKKYPSTKFYIQGQTHPVLLREQKEAYREGLEKIVKDNSLENNVIFVNKYMNLPELVDYYKAADIFMTPHLDPQQPTSGTLAYALGAGKACISTPYNYAKEVLGNDNGILVPFRDSTAISEAVVSLLSNPELMNKYQTNAFKLGKQMQWPRVAQRYLSLYKLILDDESSHK